MEKFWKYSEIWITIISVRDPAGVVGERAKHEMYVGALGCYRFCDMFFGLGGMTANPEF